MELFTPIYYIKILDLVPRFCDYYQDEIFEDNITNDDTDNYGEILLFIII